MNTFFFFSLLVMPLSKTPPPEQFGLFESTALAETPVFSATPNHSRVSSSAKEPTPNRMGSSERDKMVASMPPAFREDAAMVALYAQLPIPASPSPLLLAARRHDAEIGKALLATLTHWNLDEMDPESVQDTEHLDAHEKQRVQKENQKLGNAMSRWLSPNTHSLHQNGAPGIAQQEVAIEMMQRNADIWKPTAIGACALSTAGFNKCNTFIKAAIASAQWSLEKAQACQFRDLHVHLQPSNLTQGKAPWVGQQDLFTHAIAQGNLELVKLLHAAGWDVNRKDHAGNCPLGAARSMAELTFLLDQGADPFSTSTDGVSALQRIQGQVVDTSVREQMAKLIMTLQVASAKKNGDPSALDNLRDANRETLFEAARVATQSSFIAIWKKFRFDLSIERDKRGRTVAMLAAQGGRFATAAMSIRDGKVDPKTEDLAGYQLGAYWVFAEAVTGSNKKVLSKYIDLDTRNTAGYSVAHQALQLREPFFTKSFKANTTYGKGSLSEFLSGLTDLRQCAGGDRVWTAIEPDGRPTGEHLLHTIRRLWAVNPQLWRSGDYLLERLVPHLEAARQGFSQQTKDETLSWLLDLINTNGKISSSESLYGLIFSLANEEVNAKPPADWQQKMKQPELIALCEKLSLREAMQTSNSKPSPEMQSAPSLARRAARL